jgi:hypothetical protein
MAVRLRMHACMHAIMHQHMQPSWGPGWPTGKAYQAADWSNVLDFANKAQDFAIKAQDGCAL